MRPIIATIFLINSAFVTSNLDHDFWEFHGGSRRRFKHGLNLATSSDAPQKDDCNVRFDKHIEIKPDLLVTNDEAPAAPAINPSRQISSDRVRSKEDLLLLPDRYSVLSFDSNQGDEESSFWGRLYIKHFPDSIQYFRAHFGWPAPSRRPVKLKLASPLNMCDEATGLPILDNIKEIDDETETVLVAMRGECTFGEKALVAHSVGVAGILFVNNQEGIIHPSGPEARDFEQFSAFMITQHDGNQLIQALRRVAESTDPNHSLSGRFVPMICGNSDSSYCTPVHRIDYRFETSLNYSGNLYTEDGAKFDFVQGYFGSWLDPFVEWTTMVPTVIGGDAHCCDRAGFEGNEVAKTTAMLYLRGECDFVTKAELTSSIGAGMMIVSSHNSTLQRMGCDPPSRGRKVNAVPIMVSSDGFEELVSQFYTQKDAGGTSIIKVKQQDSVVCKDESFD
eukprot:CAMPEP_0181095702 /NCGR_PEP_ID=MMETSP1071-20121207/10652_1 /TAXON_ID=35127 /ORGANISM="Thalassiosira sp., Strain NH16" /LENGTH=448 /DNA_ID=CAMNT_0023178085 /DNA_START=696 /DNA_END=2042 /DNA_ORIENTATION=-